MKKASISLIILIIIVIGAICIFNKTSKAEKQEGKIDIITSIYPVYDFTKQVAGDKANVTMLLPTGVEIHDYEPTPQDIIEIKKSDLFLYLPVSHQLAPIPSQKQKAPACFSSLHAG